MAGYELCRCGEIAPMKITWKPGNPGRRFFGCPNYGGPGYCGYFRWHDDEPKDHNKKVIMGLLKRVKEIDGRNCTCGNKHGEDKSWLWMKCILCLIIGFVVGVCLCC